MKTKTYLCAAFIAAIAASQSAQAAHRPIAAQAHGGAVAATSAAETSNDQDASMAWRAARYPFRVGHTVVRTPLIVGQTFTGKRTFISNRGLFQMNEDADLRKTEPRGRGQRSAR